MTLIGGILICLGIVLFLRGHGGSFWNAYKSDVTGRRHRVRISRYGHGFFCLSIVWAGLVLLGAGLSVLHQTWLVWAIMPSGVLFMCAAWADYRAA